MVRQLIDQKLAGLIVNTRHSFHGVWLEARETQIRLFAEAELPNVPIFTSTLLLVATSKEPMIESVQICSLLRRQDS